MQTRTHNTFPTIHTEGALLPVDVLQRILAGDDNLGGLAPQAYHLAPNEKLNEMFNRSWSRLLGAWQGFQKGRANLSAGDPGTTLTRERWLQILFGELGFGRLQTARAVEIEGRSYAISHGWEQVPIHLVGCGIDLDRRTAGVAGASRSSPHSLLQEYLNRKEESLWGLLSNGLRLRLLRDNASLTRQAYLEFDLESMFDGEIYSDFTLLWLVCHQSRLEGEKVQECWLEKWVQTAEQRGTRALDDLRSGVEDSIRCLGSGFLRHPANQALRQRLYNGDLSRQDYYRQLLRVVYRLIFLFAAEDRGLLLDPTAPLQARQRYEKHYSTARLRRMAQRPRGGRHDDLYTALRLVMDILGGNVGAEDQQRALTGLGLPALGGYLFSAKALPDLANACLGNSDLLAALRSLAYITEGRTRRAVDYRNLGTEELGSVYESLLELHPDLNTSTGEFTLVSAAGSERKTTGSYYTPSSLIKELLDSALDPVIEQAVSGQGSAISKTPDAIEQRLLALKICDPACGSGHFLIAASHRLAKRLAQVRSGDEEPTPEAQRTALRDVIRSCIYGVDANPLAVELCRVNLWLESLEPGKPLSFLDAHIKCGDSLVGMGPDMTVESLEVPDEAFKEVTGDDKPTAQALRKRNKAERSGQESLFVTLITSKEELAAWLAQRAAAVNAMPEETAAQVQEKEIAYAEVLASQEYNQQRLAADLWSSAFFWQIVKPQGKLETLAPTHAALLHLRAGETLDPELASIARSLADRLRFFHWPLEFPEVFARHPLPRGEGRGEGQNTGFDCVLGNPPWERIKLQEQEFFASREPQIAAAPNKAARDRLIKALKSGDPALHAEFEAAKHDAEAASKFVRCSGRFPLTAVGDVNTYALFAGHNRALMGAQGRAGFIVPTGIATDDTTKNYFGDLVIQRQIASLFDFENREAIFPSVHRSYKFCLLTLSGQPIEKADFLFFATRVDHLKDPLRRFTLAPQEIALFNPNTRTMPIFRTRPDAELTGLIYQSVPVFINEQIENGSPFECEITRTFDMSRFGSQAKTHNQLREIGGFLFPDGKIQLNSQYWIPIIESKTFWILDHRNATYQDVSNEEALKGNCRIVNDDEKLNSVVSVIARFWLQKQVVCQYTTWHLQNYWLGYRNITNVTNERTMVPTVLPRNCSDYTVRLIIGDKIKGLFCLFLAGNLASISFDYFARQSVAGTNFSDYIMKQLPIIPPTHYTLTDLHYITPRMLELTCTAWDVHPFADDVWYEADPDLREGLLGQWQENTIATGGGHHGVARPDWVGPQPEGGFPHPPFKWEESRRAVLCAELDAYYARLYGLNRKQLRYILDPADLTPAELEDILSPYEEVRNPLDPQGYAERAAASTFPGETFRVLRDKDIRKYGEYRTRRLVLEAWERLAESDDAPGSPPVFRPLHKGKEKPSYAELYALDPQSYIGGQAEVFPTTHKETGQRTALKRLRKNASEDACARMKNEIICLVSSDHPHVMPLYEYDKDEYTWYSMPLANQVLSDHALPISGADMLAIARAVAQGLAVGHTRGDYHRDIKPQNILQINNPPRGLRWVIGDWGLVRQTGLTENGQTRTGGGRAFGTANFAPPEFWKDPHNIDATSDIYSLGRVIAWGLTDETPIPNVPLLPEQAGWRELVEEMTKMEKRERLPDMEAVLQWLEGLELGAKEEPPKLFQETTPPEPQEEKLDGDLGYSLYKCSGCGQMVLGFGKEEHVNTVHGGKSQEFVGL
jgi:hypothetical protein